MGFVNIPKEISLDKCYFYHTMNFPNGDVVLGDWDLRDGINDYTGNLSLGGKRVLDVGTASGCLAFYAEKNGANVTAFDMPINGNWDTVPFADKPVLNLSTKQIEIELNNRRLSEATRYKRLHSVEIVRNGFYYAHQRYQSAVRLFEGSVYEIREDVGIFDVAFIGAILLHLRDPFLALHRIAQVTTNQLVISDLLYPAFKKSSEGKPFLEFLPDANKVHVHAWWRLSPGAIESMLRTVGFKISSEIVKSYKFKGQDCDMLTLVADRVAV
jgi:hypothetical protein